MKISSSQHNEHAYTDSFDLCKEAIKSMTFTCCSGGTLYCNHAESVLIASSGD